ncbi:hypothetical protein BD309DRAFT_991565 [Dichomitus squalens]|uniref:Uncharacterized protein n=1 Tax=Dichomitus squalens TaxID=114155 RepID=A0A4V2K410_9APHY|nr:hypothetical protein BD309DRAFT_991565 [Dichomitus squalens]TBU52917.1 hypothetical protein BD310DRAFT_952438 [Dichomitus squalens]
MDYTSSLPGTLPRAEALTAVLASTFFGTFTVLAVFAVYFASRQSLRRISTIAALAITVALYALSATYTIAVLARLGRQSRILDNDLFDSPTLDCIGTATLTLTTVLTNAVVWSRVWILWGHNKVLYGASLTLLLVTLILGALSTSETCPANATRSVIYVFENNRQLPLGGFYWGSATGLTASWFSMATNTIAFILYLIKAL